MTVFVSGILLFYQVKFFSLSEIAHMSKHDSCLTCFFPVSRGFLKGQKHKVETSWSLMTIVRRDADKTCP